MAVKKYIIELNQDSNGFWDGNITDAAGNRVPSAEISALQSKLSVMASMAASVEASAHIKPGYLYWYRGKRGVGYVMVDSVNQNKVFARDSDKTGVVDIAVPPREFYEAQRLEMAKNQPQAEQPAK